MRTHFYKQSPEFLPISFLLNTPYKKIANISYCHIEYRLHIPILQAKRRCLQKIMFLNRHGRSNHCFSVQTCLKDHFLGEKSRLVYFFFTVGQNQITSLPYKQQEQKNQRVCCYHISSQRKKDMDMRFSPKVPKFRRLLPKVVQILCR